MREFGNFVFGEHSDKEHLFVLQHYKLNAFIDSRRIFNYLIFIELTLITMAKKFEIRNSTAKFLIFQIEGKEDGVQVVYRDEAIWCTQKAMAQLFDCSTDNIGLHLKNIFKSGEFQEDSYATSIDYNRDAPITREFFKKVQNKMHYAVHGHTAT